MIRRGPSNYTDSIVNSSQEEHLNVSNAIRDDAPLTNLTSVKSSLNFEVDSDGSYVLRKPLMKKSALNSANQILIYDRSSILEVTGNLLRIGNKKIILRFYDNYLKLHEIEYTTGLPVPWLTIKKYINTNTHTLLNVEISHALFLWNVDFNNNQNGYNALSHTVDSWNWMLVNDTWTAVDEFEGLTSVGDTLKRFVKIYKHEDKANTFVFEIVHPEFNSITSGLDTGNAETLDINLLLENPYAIRDLYNYGYVSCTKILPYVLLEDGNADYQALVTESYIKNKKVWELTEKGKFMGGQFAFVLLSGTNTKVFDKKYLILKAFLTTTNTPAKYYVRWEQSEDDGITWKDCPAFESQYDADQLEAIKVSDLTMAEFDKTMYNDSLEKASSYIVEKKCLPVDFTQDLSFNDTLGSRPDVLILENPDLRIKYRFVIYLDTDKDTPTPEDQTFTVVKATFNDADTGYIDSGNKIKYTTAQNNADNAPTLDTNSGAIILEEASSSTLGDGDTTLPYYYGLGSSITISCEDPDYTLKSVQIQLAPKSLQENSSTVYEFLGADIGVTGKSPLPTLLKTDDNENPYSMTMFTDQQPYHPGIPDIHPWEESEETPSSTPAVNSVPATKMYYDSRNLWVTQKGYLKAVVENYNPDKNFITFVNLTRTLITVPPNSNTFALSAVAGTSDITLCRMKIAQITVTYTVKAADLYTSTYLVSTTGAFSTPYSDTMDLAEDLTNERTRLFTGNLYYNENQQQLIVYKDNYVYSSGTNSAIIKLMNSLSVPEKITKIIPWRGYLLLFAPRNIYLASYDVSFDGYNVKTLSNTVGVSTVDADTVVPILNSVYFKSGTKFYCLVPNLYAASDDVLNVHQISTGINNNLEELLNKITEYHNFSFSDSDVYLTFIRDYPSNGTYCIAYDFLKKVWTILKYSANLQDIEKISNSEVYVKDSTTLYYFRESFQWLLNKGLTAYKNAHLQDSVPELSTFINAIPYGDSLNHTPVELITLVMNNYESQGSFESIFYNKIIPFDYQIDFGQKSSNYTVFKQYLETKLTLATLSIKDNIPLSLDIYTDGVSRELHWDANTDGALWKKSLEDVGVLNTSFGIPGADYNGIVRQLIVKYSGRGKSIRHIISGKSRTLFKFYSMDVRSRILPKKR